MAGGGHRLEVPHFPFDRLDVAPFRRAHQAQVLSAGRAEGDQSPDDAENKEEPTEETKIAGWAEDRRRDLLDQSRKEHQYGTDRDKDQPEGGEPPGTVP